jgi:hypothetical protein
MPTSEAEVSGECRPLKLRGLVNFNLAMPTAELEAEVTVAGERWVNADR